MWRHCVVMFVFLNYLFGRVFCDNFTDKYPWDTFQTRQNRLVSFHTLDQGDIELELEFKVPFLTIPIKKTMSNTHGSLANINVGAVALTGAIVFGAIIAGPALFTLLNKKAAFFGHQGNDNGLDNEIGSEPEEANTRHKRYENPSKLWYLLSTLDQNLSENNIDTTSCVQRIICWTVKNAASKMQSGKAESSDKIIEGLATNEWVNYFLKSSVFESAIQNGLRKVNCAREYFNCKINQRSINLFAQQFVSSINS